MSLSDVFGEPRVITDREEAIAFLKGITEKTGQDVSQELKWLAKLPAFRVEVHRDGVRVVGARNAAHMEFLTDEVGSFGRGREPFVLQVARLTIRAAADLLALGEQEQTDKVSNSLATLADFIQQTIINDQPRFENAMNKLAAYGFKLGELNTLLLDAIHTGLSGASSRRLAAELGAFAPALARVYMDAQVEERTHRKELSEKLDALYQI